MAMAFAGNRAPGSSIAGNTVDQNLVCLRNRGVGPADNIVKGKIKGDCGS